VPQQQQSTTSPAQEQGTSANSATTGSQSASQTQGAASGGATTQASLAGMQGGAGNQAAVEEMKGAQASEEGANQEPSGGGSGGSGLESLPPIPPIGSAVILAAAGENEWAFEGGLSVKLNELLIANPAVPLSDLLKQAAEAKYSGSRKQKDVHADVAMVGTLPSEDSDTKKATLVANQNYDKSKDLSKAIGETQALAGTLRGEGFDDIVYEDQKAADIEAFYNIEMSDAKAGDEVVLGFSGHGNKAGLVGVDEKKVSHGTINSYVNEALSEGVHLRVILDACHTGTGTNLIRDEYASAVVDKPAFLSKIYDECEVVYDNLQVNLKERKSGYWDAYWANAATHLKDEYDLYFKLEEKIKDTEKELDKGKATWKKRIAAASPEKKDKLVAISDRWESTETKKLQTEKLAFDEHEKKLQRLAKELQQNKDLKTTDLGWATVFNDAADEIWKNALVDLTYIAEFADVDAPHTYIEDYRTYGAELNYIANLKQLIIDAISAV
jgi:hypothetical protein